VSGGVEIRLPRSRPKARAPRSLRWLKQVGELVVGTSRSSRSDRQGHGRSRLPRHGRAARDHQHEQEEIAPGSCSAALTRSRQRRAAPAPRPLPRSAASASPPPCTPHPRSRSRRRVESGGAPPAERARLDPSAVPAPGRRAASRSRTYCGQSRKRVGPPAGCSRRARRTAGAGGVSDRRACRRGRRSRRVPHTAVAAYCRSHGAEPAA